MLLSLMQAQVHDRAQHYDWVTSQLDGGLEQLSSLAFGVQASPGTCGTRTLLPS